MRDKLEDFSQSRHELRKKYLPEDLCILQCFLINHRLK
jgi:hypothetical protein